MILPHVHDHTILMASMVPLSIWAEVHPKASSYTKSTNDTVKFGVVRMNITDCIVDAALASVDRSASNVE